MENPTIAQTARAINGVRKSADEAGFNAFLVAVETHYGADHLRAAHALAHDLLMEESGAVKGEDGGWYRPAPYKLIGNEVGEWVSGMYRFYCYVVAWPYSPAARGGAVLA